MWFSAINELWMFLFGTIALWCWSRDRRWGLIPFGLAMISKESAVAFLPLFFLVAPRRDWRKWVPYVAVAAVVTGSIFLTRNESFRFSDGSFSWGAPFWITWPRGTARVLWIWGWISAALVFWEKNNESRRAAVVAVCWIAISLLPYSFLTYSTQIPSRQTYLASAGLSYLVGLGMSVLSKRHIVVALAVLIVAHNVAYIAIRKRAQFLERAAPTEELIQAARQTTRPIWIRCFPRHVWMAAEAVHLATGRPVSDVISTESEARARSAAEFCYPSATKFARGLISK
jgi:hypothetical protein